VGAFAQGSVVVNQQGDTENTSTSRRIGPYVLVKRLGSGGQADVFQAKDAGGSMVAVRIIRDTFADTRSRKRLMRELRLAKRVKPFCTAKVLAEDVKATPPYMVSEFIDGPTLGQHVEQKGLMSAGDLEQLAVATATALTAIHAARVIHCDFKPDNVILGPFGPRVIDFGIAQARSGPQTDTVRGTPPYLAPERFRGDPATEKCDVFAWAATIAYAASGEPPFGRDDREQVRYRVLFEQPRLSGLSPSLEDLVRRCLAKDPIGRPSMRLVLAALLGHEDHFPTAATLKDVLVEGTHLGAKLVPAQRSPVPATGTTVVLGRVAAGPVRAEATHPWGIATAILIGACGAAVTYVDVAGTVPAAVVGVVTFAAVYLVRFVLAVLLTAGR
jgi:serine/threonine protein kinase